MKEPKVRVRKEVPRGAGTARVKAHRVSAIKERNPKGEREIAFCHAWVRHRELERAWLEAGFAPTAHLMMRRKLNTLRPYVEQLERRVTAKVVEKIAIEQQAILNEIAQVGFSNPQAYMNSDGTALLALKDLSPELARTVTNVRLVKGELRYTLPTLENKQRALRDMGQYMGLFHPKLIEEHRHLHAQKAMDLKGAKTEDLIKIRDMLATAMGPQAALSLGYRREETEGEG